MWFTVILKPSKRDKENDKETNDNGNDRRIFNTL